MGILKRIAGVVLTGAVALGVIIGAISWFQMSPQDRAEMLGSVGRVLVWLGIAAVLPWATYFFTTLVAKRESNLLAGVMIAAYTFVDGAALWLLFELSGLSTAGIFLIVLGLLSALTYNLLVCDWIAEKMG
ncbi:MAG: hypothetical protein H7144_12290 [Burkholderiales bacterium]|nr:hypothetical protein [Phycisphaerae bacterium]